MNKKRHVLPVLVGIGATALGGCDKKARAPETDDAKEQPTTSNTSPKPKPTTVIRDGDPIRHRLAGAIKPMPPPTPAPSVAPRPRSAPKTSKGAGQGRTSLAAEAATTNTADPPVAVAIVHNHPPGQPCAPLAQQEVKKALDDLRSTKQ